MVFRMTCVLSGPGCGFVDFNFDGNGPGSEYGGTYQCGDPSTFDPLPAVEAEAGAADGAEDAGVVEADGMLG